MPLPLALFAALLVAAIVTFAVVISWRQEMQRPLGRLTADTLTGAPSKHTPAAGERREDESEAR